MTDDINPIVHDQINEIATLSNEIQPLVVIRCITYNHEPYIRDALEGFVSQKTSFPFVAIVHDDASTDGTARIIREYAEKYPNIILPIYEQENQFSKKNGIVSKVVNLACDLSGAKYVALCEGDDYWTDPFKLQKQVDFLESHPDFSLCFHKVKVEVEKGMNLRDDIFDHLEEKEYNEDELLSQLTVPTCSALLRKEIFNKRPVNPNFQYGDNVLWMTCLHEGRIFGIGDIMGVYRRHRGSWTTGDAFEITKKQVIHFKALMESFDWVNKNLINQHLSVYIAKTFLIGLKNGNLDAFSYFGEGIRKYRWAFLGSINDVIKEYFHSHFKK